MTSSAPMIFLTPEDPKPSHFESGAFKVLYVYTIDDGKHTGRIKVGDATFHTDQTLDQIRTESNNLRPFGNSGHLFSTPGITAAAKRRIDEQTKTADVEYTLLWSILAVKPVFEASGNHSYAPFRDHDVHNILKRNMIGTSHHRSDKKVGEWFETDLSVVKAAVNFLQTGEKSSYFTDSEADFEVSLREEQKEAVAFTKRHFKGGTTEKPKEVLWSAIMRFGKTLTTYETVKQSPDIKKVLIVTHRPVVSDGWYEDFRKIFATDSGVHFASRMNRGKTWDQVKNETNFFYFASIQDLRGSIEEASGKFKKNEGIFATDWDLIVTDEAHEGTSTILAEAMYSSLRARYWLHLSGTPFNIVENFEQTHIYKWDYIDEQKARKQWNIDFPLDSNPYDSLPTIEIFTYDISENYRLYKDTSTIGFDFGKFFKVSEETGIFKNGKTYRKFRDEKSVWKLLEMMTRSNEYEDDKRQFPFSTTENLDIFKHTFWLVPSVESSIALEEMLSRHPVFRNYKVVNVTADNFEGDNALAAVRDAIKNNDKTITLSYGRLTTGVTVPEWTGVLIMSNLHSAMSYMQTIFRVKSGGILPDGKTKDKGYVFDFAPDRTLTMVAHASQFTRDSDDEKREAVEELLHYMPIISDAGSRFQKFDTDALMRTLNRVYISKAVNSGFETPLLYKLDAHKISSEDVEKFMKLQKTVGKHTSTNSNSVRIAVSTLSENDENVLKAKKNKMDTTVSKKELSAADKARKADIENRKAIVKVLNSVSVRIPLMVFAAPPKEKVTVKNLTDLIDDKSWGEFMPKGFTKNGESSSWESIKDYYDAVIFDGACEEIRDRVRGMDDLPVLERIAAVAKIFSTFRNPDKETILSPFSVVNRQYADTLGGLRWIDDAGLWYCSDGNSYSLEEIDDLDLTISPIWVKSEGVMGTFWSDPETSTIDINSKTALYPLYAAASMFYAQRTERERIEKPLSDMALWKKIVSEQIYVNCRVLYSKSIAQRVLLGYGTSEINASVVDVLDIRRKLIDSNVKLEDQKAIWKWLFNPKNLHRTTERANEVLTSENLIEIVEIARDSADNVEKFRAVISNPPYQMETSQKETDGQKTVTNVFQYFQEVADLVGKKVCMIYPGERWVNRSGKGMADFGLEQIKSRNLHKVMFWPDGSDLFGAGIGIAGGVTIVFKDFEKDNNGSWDLVNISKGIITTGSVMLPDEEIVSLYPELNKILEKVRINTKDKKSLSDRCGSQKLFGIESSFAEENPEKVILCNSDFSNKPEGDEWIKLFTNDLSGGGGRSSTVWFFARIKDIPNARDLIGKWKVISSSAHLTGIDGSSPLVDIIEPGTAHGRARVSLGTFDTEVEAINFFRWMQSDIIRLLLASSGNLLGSFGENVPDLGDFTNANSQIDFTESSESINDQLVRIYGLDEADKEYMKSFVSKLAPFSKKSYSN